MEFVVVVVVVIAEKNVTSCLDARLDQLASEEPTQILSGTKWEDAPMEKCKREDLKLVVVQ